MNQVKKLSLLGLTLLCLAVVISRLRGTSELPPSTAIKTSASGHVATDLAAGRLAQQPTILRAKPDGGEAEASPTSSPRPWKQSGTADGVAGANQTQLFPTGTTFINPGWFDGPAPPAGTSDLTPDPKKNAPIPAPASPDECSAGSVAPNSPRTTASSHSWPDQASYQVTVPPASQPAPSLEGDNTISPAGPPRQLVTEPNDSFWLISRRAYGSGQYYKALFEHNRQRVASPDQIDAGIEIDTPPLEELRSLYPQLFRDSGRSSAARGS
jgi:nucleoid-associated protein YgaU